LPDGNGAIAPITPDILGEAVAIEVFKRLPDKGCDAVERIAFKKRAETIRSIMRTCHDYLIMGERAPLQWLASIGADGEDISSLLSMILSIPRDTIAGIEITGELSHAALELATNSLNLGLKAPPNRRGRIENKEVAQVASNPEILDAIEWFRSRRSE
jgi:hypothetical protein